MAGIALVVAAPYLLVGAAGAGTLAGGAAITSALVAIGPGGMIGGVTVISVIGSAGGAAAAKALSAGSAADVAEAVVTLQAHALIRHRLDRPGDDYYEWYALIAMEEELADLFAKHGSYLATGRRQRESTESKLKTVRAALAWFEKQRIAPGSNDASESPAAQSSSR